MKDFIGTWIVPAVLVLGALGMGGREVIAFRRAAEPNPIRLARRLAGCLCIVGIGVLMFSWMYYLRPITPVPPEQKMVVGETTARLVWSCLGLLGAAVALAVWDVLDALRGLGRMVDRMSREDLSELEQTLGRTRKENP
ncbi:MAG: hypothetical protein ACYCW6_20865 [Candidatus Xenobia bacterium]